MITNVVKFARDGSKVGERSKKRSAWKTTFKSKSEVSSAMLDKLEDSDLDESDAKLLGYTATTAEECATKFNKFPAFKAGFLIPYFDIEGRRTKFYRYRYLETVKEGFEKHTDKKDLRYVQPKNTLNELYLPPSVDWTKVANDPTIPIVITEGELKAACACKNGIPTIGLGGVWCYKSNARGQPILEDFELFKWTSRLVYICYDSDAARNYKVAMAENALARELMILGAFPHIVRLPDVVGLKKTGLDDFIVHQGKEEFSAIVDETPSWRAAKELYELNQEVVYVQDPGVIVRLDTFQLLRPRDFVDHAYSTRRYFEEIETSKGTKVEERSAAKEWLNWPQRNTARRLAYAPGAPEMTENNELNHWRGWGCEPEQGSIKPWEKLLDHLFHNEPTYRQWFEQWLAYPLQYPGTKMLSAVLMWGLKHGTGKSMVGYSMFRIYGDNGKEIKDRDLLGPFNDWARNKQFIMGDEITGGDKRGQSDHMKSMITQERMTINQKYLPSYEVDDCINYYFTSNHPDAFFLEDDDRRYFIWEVTAEMLPMQFYKEYETWLKKEGGDAALFHHLLHLDTTDFDPKARPPLTDSKKDMANLGKSDLGSWVAQLRDDPDSVLRVDSLKIKYKLWRVDELLRIYDPENKGRVTANGMAREMRRAGVRQVAAGGPVKTSEGQFRLWAVREADMFAKMKTSEVGRYYDDERGQESNDGPKKRKF